MEPLSEPALPPNSGGYGFLIQESSQEIADRIKPEGDSIGCLGMWRMMTEQRLSVLEGWAVALGFVALLIATMVGPRLNHRRPRDELAVDNVNKTRRISQLTATLTAVRQDHAALQTQAADTERLLEQAHSELAELTQERDALAKQVAAANERLHELDGKLQITDLEATKLKEFLALQEIQKERDEAMEKAAEAEDRIRELTLQLHRAGIWP